MRLLNVATSQIEDFWGADVPEYAILSHTWGNEEVIFTDLTTRGWSVFASFLNDTKKQKKGWAKITYTCAQAKADGLRYAWIDTCCIDKGSSSELSEAINSMYRWYNKAKVCYVYLSDIDGKTLEQRPISSSRWFTRGWTLQELLAPDVVKFFDKYWLYLGEKNSPNNSDLTHIISQTTGIEADVLNGKLSIHSQSAACRMSWASTRQTTRIEDIAYCLLGIFGVNMPLLYGEGNRAFIRLQEEIIKEANDHSILAWDFSATSYSNIASNIRLHGIPLPPLAASPREFRNSSCMVSTSLSNNDQFGMQSSEPWSLTPRGLRISLPILPIIHSSAKINATIGYVAIIGCTSRKHPFHCVGVIFGHYEVGVGSHHSTHHVREFRSLGEDHSTGSTILVPLGDARRAKMETIHLQPRSNLDHIKASYSLGKLHPFAVLIFSDRARKHGLRNPTILKPKRAKCVTKQEKLHSRETCYKEEVEVSWDAAENDVFEMQLLFQFSDGSGNVFFTVWIQENRTAVFRVGPDYDANAATTSFHELNEADLFGFGKHTFTMNDLIVRVGRYNLAIFNHAYVRLEIDLELGSPGNM